MGGVRRQRSGRTVNGHLLDTNVVSELTSENSAPQVIAYLDDLDEHWLSSVVVHEMEYGVQVLPMGRRRERIYAAHIRLLETYSDRIIPLERPAAEWAAQFRVQLERQGRSIDLADALIAGTAMAHNLALVTRNVRDLAGLDIEIINPWEYETS